MKVRFCTVDECDLLDEYTETWRIDFKPYKKNQENSMIRSATLIAEILRSQSIEPLGTIIIYEKHMFFSLFNLIHT